VSLVSGWSQSHLDYLLELAAEFSLHLVEVADLVAAFFSP